MFILYCFVFFANILLIWIIVNLLHVSRNFVNLFYFLSSRPVSVNADIDTTHTVRLKSNITSLQLWIIFPVTFLFLMVWCKQKSDKKVNIFLLFLKCMTFLFLKNKILHISLMTWKLVPDQNFLLLNSWISVMISIFGYSLFILFLNLNIGIWIHIFIYWYYFQAI